MGRCGVIQLVCLLDVLPWNDVLPYSIANMTSVEYIAWVWASDTTGSIVVDLKKKTNIMVPQPPRLQLKIKTPDAGKISYNE